MSRRSPGCVLGVFFVVDAVSQLSGTEVAGEGSCSGAAACTHSTGYLWGCCEQESPLSVS